MRHKYLLANLTKCHEITFTELFGWKCSLLLMYEIFFHATLNSQHKFQIWCHKMKGRKSRTRTAFMDHNHHHQRLLPIRLLDIYIYILSHWTEHWDIMQIPIDTHIIHNAYRHWLGDKNERGDFWFLNCVKSSRVELLWAVSCVYVPQSHRKYYVY